MQDPHLATVWTARLCAALWLTSLVFAVRNGRQAEAGQVWRLLWTAGGIALGIHVLTAFHIEHRWSHTAAFEHTAEQTAATVGLDWGGGLYFNYLVVLVWLADVLRLRRSREEQKHSSVWRLFVDGFVAFMMINATVVFGPWGWWPVGTAVVLWLGIEMRRQARRRNSGASVEVSNRSAQSETR